MRHLNFRIVKQHALQTAMFIVVSCAHEEMDDPDIPSAFWDIVKLCTQCFLPAFCECQELGRLTGADSYA